MARKVWLWLDQAVNGHWPLGSVQATEEAQRKPGATFYGAQPYMIAGFGKAPKKTSKVWSLTIPP